MVGRGFRTAFSLDQSRALMTSRNERGRCACRAVVAERNVFFAHRAHRTFAHAWNVATPQTRLGSDWASSHHGLRLCKQRCERDSSVPEPLPTNPRLRPILLSAICYCEAAIASFERLLGGPNNPGKTVGVEAGAANQRAVNIRLAH